MHVFLQSQLRGCRAKPLHHSGGDLRRSDGRRESVSVRKQVALQTLRFGVQIGHQVPLAHCHIQKILARAQTRPFHSRSDIENVCPLGHGQRFRERVAARNPCINLSDRRRMVETVHTGLERSMPDPAHQIEGETAAHHARRFQLAPDAHGGGAGRNIDECLRLGPERRKHHPCRRPCRKPCNQHHPQQEACRAGTLLFPASPSAPHHPAVVDPFRKNKDVKIPAGVPLPSIVPGANRRRAGGDSKT